MKNGHGTIRTQVHYDFSCPRGSATDQAPPGALWAPAGLPVTAVALLVERPAANKMGITDGVGAGRPLIRRAV
jgi:hypothetical protein